MNIKQIFKQHYALILSFFTPFCLVLAYFISRQMFPFGENTLLTVDLGQQYIDFFAFFKYTLLHSWGSLFYSFSKGLGGEMLGDFAYYLLSPFNLILLLFSQKNILSAIMLITLLKYGFAGLNFAILLKKQNLQSGWKLPLFATSYALMGWAIANQFNLLWLDALVFLPLIILSLDLLLKRKNLYAYSLWLGIMLIINYYMGYMICLFLILFFLWLQLQQKISLKQFISNCWLFINRSCLAAGCAAIILLPTLYTLKASKGQYTVDKINWVFEYNPLKIFSKFIIGSFDFNQMPSGYPNLFISTLGLCLFLLYFFNRKIKLSARLGALLITVFLVLSLCFEPLDLLWHGLQFPVWYPYRFSFLVSFWILYLAALNFQNDFKLSWPTIIVPVIFLSLMFAYVCQNAAKFSYVTSTTLLVSAFFIILTIFFLSLGGQKRGYFCLLYLLVVSEMGCNLFFSLNNLSYLSKSDYTLPTQALQSDTKLVKQKDQGFYRIGQTYARTKNDGLAHNFFAGSYFSSALEKSLPDFYGQLGNPDGDNYITYTNGTLISDSLLGIKYFFDNKDIGEVTPGLEKNQLQAQTIRPDLNLYQLTAQNSLTNLYQNPFALSIGYVASNQMTRLTTLYNDPVSYQTNWLNALSATPITQRYFTAQNFNEVVFQNTKARVNLTGETFVKEDSTKEAQIIFKFTPTTNNSYYLTLGPQLDDDNVTWYLGNQKLSHYGTFRHTVILNIANHDKDNEIVLTAKFKKNKLNLDNFVLYELDNNIVLQKLHQLQQQQLKITKFSANHLTGTIKVKTNQGILTTTIPYSAGWHVKIDGKITKTFKVQETFLATKISKGTHQIEIYFVPPYLYLGLFISFCSCLLLFILTTRHKLLAKFKRILRI